VRRRGQDHLQHRSRCRQQCPSRFQVVGDPPQLQQREGVAGEVFQRSDVLGAEFAGMLIPHAQHPTTDPSAVIRGTPA